MRKTLFAILLSLGLSAPASAEEYVIDTKGAHASITFRIQHLGYSWLYGRFNTFSGHFSYDEGEPASAAVEVSIDTTSVDSNHAERDKHLRSDDFLAVGDHPEATFVSTAYEPGADGHGVLHGNLTLRGVTKPVAIEVEHVGAGPDPWGGYRRGFSGTTSFALADFGIPFDLGPASREVELLLQVEGIRQ